LHQDRLALWLVVAVAALCPLVVWAFWPRYLSPSATAALHTHAHAVLGTTWLLLLVAQPLLVRARRFAAHRGLGRVGVLVGIAFVASSVVSAQRWIAGLDEARIAQEGGFLYMILGMALMFAAALVLGIAWRRSPAVHGRFMACTLLPLLDPVFARILGFHFPPLPAAFLYQAPALLATIGVLAALALTLPRAASGRTAFLAFAWVSTLLFLLFFAIERHPAWLAFVAWFRAVAIA
jgi:hypothetical protein